MSIYFGSLKRLGKSPLNWTVMLAFSIIIVMACFTFGRTNSSVDSNPGTDITVGILDRDGSLLSKTLAQNMQMRYNIKELTPDSDIVSELANQDMSYALVIGEGYQEAILSGRAPTLESAALEMSDVQHLAATYAQNQTRALITLAAGADEGELPALIEDWRARSGIEVTTLSAPILWENIAYWFNFYAWMAPLISFFLVKTLMVDRRGGLPERIGVLPHARRSYLLGQILAAFTMAEVPVLILLLGIPATLGYAMPNPGHLFLLLSLYSLYSTALSVGFYSVIRSEGTVMMIIIMTTTFLSMVGGTYWPVEIMPEFLQKLAAFSPNYWFGKAMTGIESITATEYGLPALMILAFTALLFLLGSWIRPQRAD